MEKTEIMILWGCLIGNGIFILESKNNKYMLHQGANDGFRALCFYCFDGVDKNKGFVIVSTGGNNSIIYNSEVSQQIIKYIKLSDIDDTLFLITLDNKNCSNENIVNKGYKDLLFNAFIR
jgi:hypothetical protein